MTEQNKDGESACDCGGGSCCSGPGKWIWIALILAVAGVLIAKQAGKKKESTDGACVCVTPTAGGLTAVAPDGKDAAVKAGAIEPVLTGSGLPRLVDVGAGKCVPCIMMAPILDDLKKTYAGKLDVVFIDVWENPDAGKPYGINLIPTQIFYDAQGKELFRHEGFFAKEDILAKWKELGVDLSTAGTNTPSGVGHGGT